jgi:hypothetical protein
LGRIGRLSPSKLEEEGQPAAAGSGRARTDEGRRGSTRARTEGLGGSLLPRAARRAEDPAATRRRRREAWRVCLGLGFWVGQEEMSQAQSVALGPVGRCASPASTFHSRCHSFLP